jgi:hypothetical protein
MPRSALESRWLKPHEDDSLDYDLNAINSASNLPALTRKSELIYKLYGNMLQGGPLILVKSFTGCLSLPTNTNIVYQQSQSKNQVDLNPVQYKIPPGWVLI